MKQIILDTLMITSIVLILLSFSVLMTDNFSSGFLNVSGIVLFVALGFIGLLLFGFVNNEVKER